MSEELTEKRSIETITAEILIYKAQAGAAILEIGKRLIEAKEQLSHGEWCAWLRDRVDFSERSAQNFMRLAREYPNPQTFADLGASKALALLALPESERDRFVEEKHSVDGREKSVAEMSARELKRAIEERDEARLAAERAGEVSLSMEQRAKKAEQDAARAEEELKKRTEELEALRSRPAEVATVTVRDEDAIRQAAEDARREAEDKLAKKLQKAENAKKKAEEEKAEAEQLLAQAKADREQADLAANRERERMSGELDAMRKRLAVVSSPEATAFKVHFEQLQASANKMLACIDRIRESGDAETAQKLRKALHTLASAVASRSGDST